MGEGNGTGAGRRIEITVMFNPTTGVGGTYRDVRRVLESRPGYLKFEDSSGNLITISGYSWSACSWAPGEDSTRRPSLIIPGGATQ